jgi:hypothetical protein
MPGPAAATLASQSGEIAEAAKDSEGANIGMALVAVAIVYVAFRWVNTTSEVVDEASAGVGDAGQAVGSTAGEAFEGYQDVLQGAGDAVEDGTDYTAGGTADTVENAGDFWLGGPASTVNNAGDAAGEGFDFVAGGAADTVKNADDVATDVGGGLVDTLNPNKKGFF